jgi:hypothetical protein
MLIVAFDADDSSHFGGFNFYGKNELQTIHKTVINMANEPVPLSELGIIANNCARYCVEKDGLELWLSFVDVCTYTVVELQVKTYNYKVNTPVYSGIVCATTACICYIAGYLLRFRMFSGSINR